MTQQTEVGIGIDGVLQFVGEQAQQMAILRGKYDLLLKHSDAQAKELAELRKQKPEAAPEQ